MALDVDRLVKLLDAGDGRAGMLLVTNFPMRVLAVDAEIREILRLAALGAQLEEHVRFESPVAVVQQLYFEFQACWPRDTP